MTLPDDYRIPDLGAMDRVGHCYATGADPCYADVPAVHQGRRIMWACTLPVGHTCPFHVAHDVRGYVIGVQWSVEPHLRLPEGM